MPHSVASIIWRRAGVDQAANVLNIESLGAVNISNSVAYVDEIAEAVRLAWVGSDYRDRVGQNWTPHRVELRPGHDTSFPPVSSLIGAGTLAGLGSNDSQSALIAIAVSAWPATGNPGRIFLVGWDEAVNAASGRPAAGVSDAAVDFGQRLVAEIETASTPTLAVWSIYRRSDQSLHRVITILRSASSAAAGWQTQRRRRFAIRQEI